MKQILIRKGKPFTAEVHKPTINEYEILISTKSSCVSYGTELTSLKASSKTAISKIFEKPKKIIDGLEIIKENGFEIGFQRIKTKLDNTKTVGYSAAGEILEIGEKVKGFKIGDRVACAGGGYAYHAEVLSVPENLVVKMPNNITYPEASTCALGSIALQGVRRLNPTLGEGIVVIGLGLIGQITVQLLIASGCRVYGIDLSSSRNNDAVANGAKMALKPSEISNLEKIDAELYPLGMDGVIITAGSESNEIISQAFQMCRKKGRVVITGDVGLKLDRDDFYSKEIDILISCSYGPGRYDTKYEEKSMDYPLPYVRWTENRNIEEYLRLISEKRIVISDFIKNLIEINKSDNIYSINEKSHYTTIINYSLNDSNEKNETTIEKSKKNRINNKNKGIGIIGVGNFAKLKVLPNIIKILGKDSIEGLVTKNGASALSTIQNFKLDCYTDSNYRTICNDPNIDTIFVLTRHNTHFEILKECIENGKNIFVEKPTVISPLELKQLLQVIENNDTYNNILHTGYNRRFSPHIKFAKEKLKNNSLPIIIEIRVNAGYINPDHWVFTEEGGGRNIGECCHFYDLMSYLANSKVQSINALAIQSNIEFKNSPDNFTVNLQFENGSIGCLTYTSKGSILQPKEKIEIFFSDSSLVIDDFKESTFYSKEIERFKTKVQDKGHDEQIRQFLQGLSSQQNLISLEDQFHALKVAFQVEDQINGIR